ncbi:MAG: ribonucleoside-diphosphate reductase subunit alpha [Verrucomicrobiales bacterium]
MSFTSPDFVRQDLELKRVAHSSAERPRFDWGASTRSLSVPPRVRVGSGDEQRPVDTAHLAELIGSALTDLLLARHEQDIFCEKNQRRVAALAAAVHQELDRRAQADPLAIAGDFVLSEEELARIIESALIRHNQFDIARSLISRHRSADRTSALPDLSATPQATAAPLPRLIRRNGQAVSWNQNKVEIAIAKAFLSVQQDPTPAAGIAQAVTDSFAQKGQDYVNIEDVQDQVQEELMRRTHYKVAEHYILYRSHRAELRRQENETAALHSIDSQQAAFIEVVNEDDSSEFWAGQDLRKRIDFAMLGLDLCLSRDQIEVELRRSLFNGIKRDDLQKVIVLNGRTLIEKDADFAKFAARLLLTYIYEEVLGWDIGRDGIDALPEFHRRAFKANLVRGVEIHRLNPALLDLELDKLSGALDPSADLDFDYLGIQTLYDRYLIVDKTAKPHRRIETPQLFWMRVAMGLFLNEPREMQARDIVALYQLYKSRRFCSSTPTLFNSGTRHSQLSSCYLYKVDDTIESIMYRGIAENAFLSKWAGGLGGSWTSVRGTGSYIQGTNGESQGVIPFLKLHNDQLVAVNQGGKRRGSGCAYLETWHLDIMDFLRLRENTGDERRRTHDMNTANWIPDLFMKRVEARENWTLFRSNEVPDLHELFGRAFEERYSEYEEMAARGDVYGKSVPAIDLWKDMLKMLFETGHPWITFKDPCNVRSPQDHAGVIHSSNLCTEITLNTSADETAVCNLGSIVLENHLTPDGALDLKRLRETIRIAVRALDNVIDINFYPTEPARRANTRHRPIGLGVMGLANALFKKGIAFASAEAVEFNDEFMEAVAYYAYEASSDLAAERGSYSTFQGSKWQRGLLPPDTVDLLEQERGLPINVPRGGRMDWTILRDKIAVQGMRNSNVLAIAPTATISNIVGSSACIEPAYKNLFVKANLSGDFVILNEYLVRDLKKLGLWDQQMVDELKYFKGELSDIPRIPADLRHRYRTAFSIDYHWLIQAAARRQKWIDQSQSVNLFLAEPELKTMSHMYRAAWHAGLKTTYYLRTLSATNIEEATVAVAKELRGVIATTVVPLAAVEESGPGVRACADSERTACSLEAALSGVTCEACQ